MTPKEIEEIEEIEEYLNKLDAYYIRYSQIASPQEKMIKYLFVTCQRRQEKYKKLLKMAIDALRSYEYGNSSPTLAKAVADKLEE